MYLYLKSKDRVNKLIDTIFPKNIQEMLKGEKVITNKDISILYNGIVQNAFITLFEGFINNFNILNPELSSTINELKILSLVLRVKIKLNKEEYTPAHDKLKIVLEDNLNFHENSIVITKNEGPYIVTF